MPSAARRRGWCWRYVRPSDCFFLLLGQLSICNWLRGIIGTGGECRGQVLPCSDVTVLQ
jgi:hypothetical protein